jgi:hypothetical protein
LRDDQRSVEEAGLADVGNATIDDDARIKNAVALLRTRVPKEGGNPGRLQPFPFSSTHDNAEIRKDEQNETVEKDDPAIAGIGPEERGANRLGETKPNRTTNERTEQIGDLSGAKPRFDPDDQNAQCGADQCGQSHVDAERTGQDRGVSDRQYKKDANE